MAANGKVGDLGVAEAAKKLGVTVGYVYVLIWSDRLPAKKVGRLWRINLDAVKKLAKARAAAAA